MSKAILVLDEMPKNCAYCYLTDCNGFNDYYCCCTVKWVDLSAEVRPSACPLKQAPEPKSNGVTVYGKPGGEAKDYATYCKDIGYNKALRDCGVIE